MKLRIERNSLRLRLSQPEVEQLAKNGQLMEEIVFPDQRKLIYEVCSDDTAKSITAGYLNNMIVFRIPSDMINQWSASDMVGIEGAIHLENGDNLSILVEKDFKKLTRKDKENQEGLYPNPKARN